ncbi:MAG: hypothetical protein OXL41_04030, partial [Nitrospinae bacterium]|nr:hypothetical protein [Nitrospinota bacterium]
MLSSEDEGFDLPVGFLRENDETEYAKSLFLDGGNIPTQKADFIPTGTYRGRVWFYWLTPTRVMFDRKMGEPRTVDFLHFARSEVPTQDSDEGPWLRNASLLVIGLAGNKLAGLRDTRALQVFSGMAQGGQRTLLQQ